MTGEPFGCTEACNQVVETHLGSRVFWVEFLQTAFYPERCEDCGSAMARADNVDEVEVVFAGEVV